MEKRKIAYVVTPDGDYSQWTIYYFVKFREGTLTETSNITGYGLEQLLPYLNGAEIILQTGKTDISFLMSYNNQDVNGKSEFDRNLPNTTYIMEMINNGAIQIQNLK